MWDVSERFLTALRSPHQLRTVATVTPPGGDPTTLNVTRGRITAKANSNIRRRGSLTLEGDSAVFDLLATPGAVVEIQHGIVFGNSEELVPVFTGELSSPAQPFGDGSIVVSLADFGRRVARNSFTSPYQPTATTGRLSAIEAVASAAFSSLTVTTTATDTGTVGAGRLWVERRWDAITDLARDAGAEAFFLPDGTFLVRNLPSTSDRPVWTVNAGASGVLEGGTRTRDTDQLYNTVIVRPTATDGSQTWSPQTVTVPVGDPRHPDLIGVAPYFLDSPTITTAGEALAAGQRQLDRLSGALESLRLDAVANPALECGDVVRAITPNLNLEPGRAFQHFIDALSIDLVTGSMTLDTRSQVVTNG